MFKIGIVSSFAERCDMIKQMNGVASSWSGGGHMMSIAGTRGLGTLLHCDVDSLSSLLTSVSQLIVCVCFFLSLCLSVCHKSVGSEMAGLGLSTVVDTKWPVLLHLLDQLCPADSQVSIAPAERSGARACPAMEVPKFKFLNFGFSAMPLKWETKHIELRLQLQTRCCKSQNSDSHSGQTLPCNCFTFFCCTKFRTQ